LALAAAIVSCGAPPPKETKNLPSLIHTVSLCTLVTYEDATKALGAPPVGSMDTSDHGALNPGCSWMADIKSLGETPRMLVFTVWRKKSLTMQGAPMSGISLYEDEVGDIHEEFSAAQPLYGVGEEGVIGFEPGNKGLMRGRIVARKGEDVLTMQITGADKATFEAIARKVSAAM
jgi:hypothetical protein